MENKICLLCYTTEEDTTLDKIGTINSDGYQELITIDVIENTTNLNAVKIFLGNVTKKKLDITYIGDLTTKENTVYVYGIDITGSKFLGLSDFKLVSLSQINDINDAILQASIFKLIQLNTII